MSPISLYHPYTFLAGSSVAGPEEGLKAKPCPLVVEHVAEREREREIYIYVHFSYIYIYIFVYFPYIYIYIYIYGHCIGIL